MTRVEAVNYLLSRGISSEQIKAVLEPFTHEEAFKREADIIIYIKASKDYDALFLAEYINAIIYDIPAVDDYNTYLLQERGGSDNEDT